jgi:transposase
MWKSIEKERDEMKAYSQDLRERILRAVDQGKPRAQITRLFEVSVSTIKRYVRQRREKGHVEPKPIPGRPATKRAALEAQLQPQLESQPDATLQEHCDIWQAKAGIKVSISTMSRAMQHLSWTRKKKSSKQMREKKKSATNGERKQKSLRRAN